jgi:hypothetical protein
MLADLSPWSFLVLALSRRPPNGTMGRSLVAERAVLQHTHPPQARNRDCWGGSPLPSFLNVFRADSRYDPCSAGTPPFQVPMGGRGRVCAGLETSRARATPAGLGGLFYPSTRLVCMLSQRCI